MKQPWIHSPALDGALILAPAFVTTAAVLLFPSWLGSAGVSTAAWVALVLCVDVAHVYSSLYRSYLDRGFLRDRPMLALGAPAACWGVGAMLYAVSGAWFWRGLTYLAVFHFVRQQYGFLRLYAREEKPSRLDSAMIYLATLYPLAYWHSHLPRSFHWFIEGDFLPGLPGWVASFTGALYLAVACAYVAKEARATFRTRRLNLPKQVLVLGTALSWYVGIVRFNGDLAFTATNVVAHGVPYLALVWAVGRKETGGRGLYRLAALPAFFGILLALAYLEEGLWDGFVWREHLSVFPLFGGLAPVRDPLLLALLAPLLALPQSTHYVLDGFLWRRGRTSLLPEKIP